MDSQGSSSGKSPSKRKESDASLGSASSQGKKRRELDASLENVTRSSLNDALSPKHNMKQSKEGAPKTEMKKHKKAAKKRRAST